MAMKITVQQFQSSVRALDARGVQHGTSLAHTADVLEAADIYVERHGYRPRSRHATLCEDCGRRYDFHE